MPDGNGLPVFEDGDDWEAFQDQLEQWMVLNPTSGNTDEKKLAALLIALHKGPYQTLVQLSHPIKPKDRTYDEVLELLQAYFDTPTLFRAQRNKLQCREQRAGESTADYVLALRKQAMKCKFRNNNELEYRLVDQLIFGIRDKKAKSALLKKEEQTLTLKQAMDIITTEELANKGIKDNGGARSEDVSEVSEFAVSHFKNPRKFHNGGAQFGSTSASASSSTRDVHPSRNNNNNPSGSKQNTNCE